MKERTSELAGLYSQMHLTNIVTETKHSNFLLRRHSMFLTTNHLINTNPIGRENLAYANIQNYTTVPTF